MWQCRFCAQRANLTPVDCPSKVCLCQSIDCQHSCQIIIRRNYYMPTYKPQKHSRPEIAQNDVFSAASLSSFQCIYIQSDPSNRSVTIWTNRDTFYSISNVIFHWYIQLWHHFFIPPYRLIPGTNQHLNALLFILQVYKLAFDYHLISIISLQFGIWMPYFIGY